MLRSTIPTPMMERYSVCFRLSLRKVRSRTTVTHNQFPSMLTMQININLKICSRVLFPCIRVQFTNWSSSRHLRALKSSQWYVRIRCMRQRAGYVSHAHITLACTHLIRERDVWKVPSFGFVLQPQQRGLQVC
jgi:hypothetical protein